MRKKIYAVTGVLVLLLVMTALFMGFFSFGPQTPAAPQTPKVKAESDKRPDAITGQVAGAQTVRTASSSRTAQPPVRVVVSDGTKSRTITYTPPEGDNGEMTPQPPADPDDTTPQPPVPTEITINLRGPLEYRLDPGKHTPILTYELTDGAKREWFPGVSAGWMYEPQPTDKPVWATVLEKRPTGPFMSDHVYFSIAARADAKPGVYKTSVRMVLRPGITLGVPVMVTIPAVQQHN